MSLWETKRSPKSTVAHLSYSSIRSYITCPSAWAARYLDKISEAPSDAAGFGLTFEKYIASQVGFKTDLKEPIDVNVLEIAASFLPEFLKWKGDVELTYQEQIFITCEQWAAKAEEIGADTEIPFPIKGFLDFRKKDFSNEITDLKTGTAAAYKPEFTLQQTLYCIFKDSSKFNIFHINSKTGKFTPYTVNVTKQMKRETMDTLAFYSKQMAQVIANPYHLPKLPGEHCRWCPLKSMISDGAPECALAGV